MSVWSLIFLLATVPQNRAASPRMQQYLGLAEATLRSPIQPAELEQALLSEAGVAEVRSRFEASLADSIGVEGSLVTPELGGEATLTDGRVVLVSYPDPLHPLVREMVRLESRPDELLRFLQGSAGGKELLASTGGLHALLYQMANAENGPTPTQRELLGKIVGSAVATHFKTWSTDPVIQARMIEENDWRGRYVGFWHIHPPRLRGAELLEGIEPSVQDMTQAKTLGQFLTIVFQPDGFDAFDLSLQRLSAEPDLRRARLIRYRSPEWRRHFEALVAEGKGEGKD